MRKLKKIFIPIYFIIIIFWVGLSLFRTVNNLRNLAGDFYLIPLSEEKRNEIVYGNLYKFCKFAASKTPTNSEILFLSSGAKPFYFCRYRLYPRKLYFARSVREAEDMRVKRHYNYILIYTSSDPLEDENHSSQWDLSNYNTKNIYKNGNGVEGRVIAL